MDYVKIGQLLDRLRYRDLYEFLASGANSTAEDLRRARPEALRRSAQDLYDKVHNANLKGPPWDETRELTGVCQSVFRDAKTKEKYDVYLGRRGQRHLTLREILKGLLDGVLFVPRLINWPATIFLLVISIGLGWWVNRDEDGPVAQSAIQAARLAEEALGLDGADRRQYQERLWEVGFDPGPADGDFGSGTRDAIRAWQASRGVAATGYLSVVDVRELGLRVPAPPRVPPPGPDRDVARMVEEALQLDGEARRSYQEVLRLAGFDPGPANGVFGPGTRDAIRAWQASRGVAATGYLSVVDVRELGLRVPAPPRVPPPGPDRDVARMVEEALQLDGEARRSYQEVLRLAGFDPGPANGVFGPGTRDAIRAWQASRGVAATGYLTLLDVSVLLRLGGGGVRRDGPR